MTKTYQITPEILRAAGFSKHPPCREYASALWQKCIEDPDPAASAPVRYFVNIHEWPVFKTLPASWSAEARLYFPGPEEEDRQGDLSYFIRPSTTVDEILAFYANAFQALGCVPDRHNQP